MGRGSATLQDRGEHSVLVLQKEETWVVLRRLDLSSVGTLIILLAIYNNSSVQS